MPSFDNVFGVGSCRVVGRGHRRLRLRIEHGATVYDAVHVDGDDGAAPPRRLRALYQLAIDECNGARRLNLTLRHVEALDPAAAA